MSDLIILLGQCDLYFMVLGFCLISPTLFDGFMSNLKYWFIVSSQELTNPLPGPADKLQTGRHGSLPKQTKNLNQFYKTDLDFGDCFGRNEPSYIKTSWNN